MRMFYTLSNRITMAPSKPKQHIKLELVNVTNPAQRKAAAFRTTVRKHIINNYWLQLPILDPLLSSGTLVHPLCPEPYLHVSSVGNHHPILPSLVPPHQQQNALPNHTLTLPPSACLHRILPDFRNSFCVYRPRKEIQRTLPPRLLSLLPLYLPPILCLVRCPGYHLIKTKTWVTDDGFVVLLERGY
jgi:hypothetical protein